MRLLFPAIALAAHQAHAETPRIVVDTAPLHSLVAQLMQGVGEPALLLPPGANPHDYALRPSDASALADADIIVWVGHGLTPWLEEPIETLAPNATVIEALDLPGWTALPFRDDPMFADAHDHGGDEGHDEHEDHEEDEHHDEHGDHEDHDEHEDHTGHEDHGHGETDPHAWLDPAIALHWAEAIAANLALADPENAGLIAENLATLREDLTALSAEIDAQLAPFRADIEAGTAGYIVPHDALQYFETAFAIPASGAISLADSAAPGPAHLRELQEKIAETNITCILTEPISNPATVAILTDGTEIRTTEMDPAGALLTPGVALYADLMRGLSGALAECLGTE